MPIDLRLLQWAADVMGEQPYEARGLRDGGAPWLLRFEGRSLVLRIGARGDAESTRVEQLGLSVAAAHDVAVSRAIAADADHDPPLLLVEAVDGSSAIPHDRSSDRLHTLGALGARLHAIAVGPEIGLPRRNRPIASVDFGALRAQQPTQPLLAKGEVVVREHRPASSDGFMHGDLWQGNTVWRGAELVAVIDWDCAGVGPAGVDLGSLRCDAAVCFGTAAAADVLAGWEAGAARAADDVAYWDVVAALSTPPDMSWFAAAIAGQGRADLTQEILRRRRDEFLASALDSLGAL